MSEENKGFDIIIPYHGQYKLVRDLIGSVCLFTRHIPYRITIVDDGSDNKDFFYSLAQASNIDGIRHEQQKGFGAAINSGIKATKQSWVVLLNSDCVIEEMNWLSELWKTMVALRDKNVRFVSSRTDNPPSCYSEVIKSPRIDRKIIEDTISDVPLPMFCCLLSRKMIDQVGLLKEYPYGFYEDEEYFYRMKKFGFKQAISKISWVKHGNSATVQELWRSKPETKEVMLEGNRNACLADVKKLSRA
jgi:GT2 family glycosyltransferase